MILLELMLMQEKKRKFKVYSMYALGPECIAKGNAHKPYEFGVKTSLTTTTKGGFILGAMSCPGNPFNRYTLVHNLRKILAHLKCLVVLFWAWILAVTRSKNPALGATA